jgi:hypothetical protein
VTDHPIAIDDRRAGLEDIDRRGDRTRQDAFGRYH